MVDLLIVAIVIFQAVHWAGIGLLRGGFSLAGFIVGIFLGSLLVPFVVGLFDGAFIKLIVAVSVLLIAAMTIGIVGRIAGEHLSALTKKIKLGPLDSILGASLGVIITLVFTWFFAAILAGSSISGLNRSLNDSAILRTMDRQMPPAPAVIARISSFINSHGFPQVFVGLEPRPVEPVETPSSEDVNRALQAAQASTVRIESLGCGGQVFGSGFVAADGLVATNAHVVAGIDNPVVVDTNGYHRARTVYFDKDLDLAVLRVGNLAGEPLPISEQIHARGTSAAAVGYPGGGRLTAVPAGILRDMLARGRDIYGGGISVRHIYELQTSIEQGNSGGPVVLPDGTVIGMVFAKSQTEPGIGYSLVSTDFIKIIRESANKVQTVNTGYCVPN